MAITDKQPLGYRNHYLRFDPERTWAMLSGASSFYDTIMGCADQAGFRNGM